MAKKKSWLGDVKDVFYTSELADLLGLMAADDFDENVQNSAMEVYGYARREAEQEAEGDMTEEQLDEVAVKAEQEYIDDEYRKYSNAVETVAEKIFGQHGLVLTEMKKGGHKVEPEKSWRDAAFTILDTINGVGYFHFSSLKEFLLSGPYTAREAVLSHLAYMKRRSEVYGDTSPQRMFEIAMR